MVEDLSLRQSPSQSLPQTLLDKGLAQLEVSFCLLLKLSTAGFLLRGLKALEEGRFVL